MAGPHGVQIIVGRNAKNGQNLIEHFPVLSGVANSGVELGNVLLEVADHWAEFDSLGPGSENEEYFVRQISG